MNDSAIQRFWAKVDRKRRCWEWTGALLGKGYGQFWTGDERILAHRFSWLLHFGKIPLGIGWHGTCVLHKCDNARCVRPDHLFLGTNGDNVRDMVAKGRFTSPAILAARNRKRAKR